MPEPYYEQDGITIYHGDCREILPSLAPADAVITDPPYGTGYYETDKDSFASRVLDAAPVAAVFGWPELLVEWCIRVDRVPTEWVTWAPPNGSARGGRAPLLVRESESIAIFGDFDADAIRVDKTGSSAQIAAKIGREPDRRLGDVWTDSGPACAFSGSVRVHPNEKPVPVLMKLVGLLTVPGDLVIDPYMGSGTTLRAAKDLGRRAIGIEVEERYCEVAVKRLAQGVLI